MKIWDQMEAILHRLENLESKTKRLQKDMEHLKAENSKLKEQNESLQKKVVVDNVEVEQSSSVDKKEDISSGWSFW
jgi:predicted nuclease with TOPRIM domain